MSRVGLALLGLLVIAFAGCGRGNKETTEQKQAPAAQQPAVQPTPQPAPEGGPQTAAQLSEAKITPQEAPRTAQKAKAEKKPQTHRAAARVNAGGERPVEQPAAPPVPTAAAPAPPVRQQVEPPAPPVVQEPRFVTIPSGTSIQVRLQDPLDSGVNKTGDTFRAILDRDIVVDEKAVAARGSILQGKLSHVAQSGRVEGRAAMSMQLISLGIGSQNYPIQTEILSFEAESTKKKDATKVGLGAGLGAVIGAIAGGGKGAAIGGAIGAGAGGATVVATRGKELTFEVEHKLNFALTHDISVKLQ